MFYACDALTSLDLTSFNTKKVTNMAKMFYGCDALTSLDLSGFDTRSVQYIGLMFYNCKSLVSLDLSGFDMRRVRYTGDDISNSAYMFSGCYNLKEIIMRGCDKKTIEIISKVKPREAVIITD